MGRTEHQYILSAHFQPNKKNAVNIPNLLFVLSVSPSFLFSVYCPIIAFYDANILDEGLFLNIISCKKTVSLKLGTVKAKGAEFTKISEFEFGFWGSSHHPFCENYSYS